MGFGLIFAGYLSFLFFKVLPPAMLVGAYLMEKGLEKLVIYGKPFERARNAAWVLCGYYALYTALWAGDLAGVSELLNHAVFGVCDSILYGALVVIFHILLYSAFEEMAKECGFDKGVKSLRFCRVLTATYVSLTVLNLVFTSAFQFQTYFPLAVLIGELVWFVYTSLTIYSFYRHIATDEVIAEEEKRIAEYESKRNKK